MMLVTHPLGNACVRALLRSLHMRGLLARYVTTLGFHQDDRWLERMPAGWRSQLERRRYDLPGDLMERRPWREAARLTAGMAGFRPHEGRGVSVDAVFHDLDRKAASQLSRERGLRGVYAYEDGALALFSTADPLGLARCYELPMGYWREAQRIFREEAELQPEWAPTLAGLKDSAAKLERKDAELASASQVIVASEFSRRTLAAYRGRLAAPIAVAPHGAPLPISEAALKERLRRRPAGALRVLFVGGLTQRKGLSYLFEAMKQVGAEATLTVVGQRGSNAECPALTRELRRHEHVPSLPPAAVLALMQQHDVLVLPSLFEGFGLVLLEAMAQGLPVIATPHTAAPDLLAHGEGGLLVPIRSAPALAAAISGLARNSDRRDEMALAARRIAERSSWDVCAERLADIAEAAMASNAATSTKR